MKAMGQNAPESMTLDGNYPFELRAKLIMEEAREFVEACGLAERTHTDGSKYFNPIGQPDFAKMIDAIMDIMYVTLGAAVAGGVPIEPFWKAVHAANMAKSTGPVRDDGKRLKPEGWTPPDIEGIMAKVRDTEKQKNDFLASIVTAPSEVIAYYKGEKGKMAVSRPKGNDIVTLEAAASVFELTHEGKCPCGKRLFASRTSVMHEAEPCEVFHSTEPAEFFTFLVTAQSNIPS